MLAFPIADSSIGLSQYCCWEKLDGVCCLRFFSNGKQLEKPVVATDPEREQYALLESMISGGTYREFLTDALERFDGRVCLYLRSQVLRFPLPCPDGVGKPLQAEGNLTDYQYSQALCSYWRIENSPKPSMTLADVGRAISDKYRIAEQMGVPYLIADPEILKQQRLPANREP